MTPQQVELETFGRVWIRNAVSQEIVERLQARLATQTTQNQTAPGARMVLDDTLRPILGPDAKLTHVAQQLLRNARPVRIVSFNKTTDMNWGVPWHQDRVIAVREKCAVPGFTSWTKKPDFWHVEPPVTFLDAMIFARIHLDDETPHTGGLELALKSHHAGIIPAARADSQAQAFTCEACHASPGDVVFVKALTLHRSAPSTAHLAHRRTLRVDYCAEDLPPTLTVGNITVGAFCLRNGTCPTRLSFTPVLLQHPSLTPARSQRLVWFRPHHERG